MSYLVVGKKSGEAWDVEVRGVGTTTSPDLNGVEAAARALLASEGKADAATVDLQLLLPDFEADLDEARIPRGNRPNIELISGLILLAVVVGAAAFVLGRVL
ncbi:hypothetical protein J2X11_001454 [Aeromicrobium panaciterrae]|uniref:Uncharacterized protein n=1 Tax=Aeromicrobium panaciterrae TaxID=363861 RepID=A0ABU1UNB3_9ACTN|nr:hypothetical protein [Aeromicrobium panaciterrae]MDR7086615.1 hypothetical protein [Aeromicrobium panaciterrae]